MAAADLIEAAAVGSKRMAVSQHESWCRSKIRQVYSQTQCTSVPALHEARMKSFSNPAKRLDSDHDGKIAAEHFAQAVATRHGFRAHDFSIVWDGGELDASRSDHEMIVMIKDGRRAAAHIDDDALLRRDAWKYLREVDAAFAQLARRPPNRGI